MPVTVNKIDTSVVAETLRQQIREDVAIVPGARPRLVGFLANKDPAARKYAEWTGRACTKDGIDYVLKEVEACDLEGALKEANEDAGVHGILLCIIQNFTAPS
jgi:methylenetetrahydrofolate dehydrogenase (NAD+)